MKKHIYLIRHCQADGQEAGAPLTEKGRQDALHLADFLKDAGIEAIFSSPFERAVHTAGPLAQHLGLNTQRDDRLMERTLSSENMPDWLERLKVTFNDLSIKYHGGESSSEAMDRAMDVINEIISLPIHTAAVVTHGNLMTLILRHFDDTFGFEAWKALTNPDVYLLMLDEEKIEIKRIWL